MKDMSSVTAWRESKLVSSGWYKGETTDIEMDLVRRNLTLHGIKAGYGIVKELQHEIYSLIRLDERIHVRLDSCQGCMQKTSVLSSLSPEP